MDERGIAAASTLTLKAANEDAWALARDPEGAPLAVVVADGIGSQFGAGHAARTVSQRLCALFERPEPPTDPLDWFTEAADSLTRAAEAHPDLPPDLDWSHAFGTTAICAVDRPHELVLAYAGNGAIFHLRGNFDRIPPSQLLPWGALNYLNPHTVPKDGKNLLYRRLAPRAGPAEWAPTVLRLSKDELHFGDIVMLCTDGVYSYDQTPIGFDADQQVWISGERSMLLFYRHLAAFFERGTLTDDALAETLRAYLEALREERLVKDDCTVAVLVTARALRFQRIRRTDR